MNPHITLLPIVSYGITLNELPTEFALYFEVGNCQAGCEGCHSQHLWCGQSEVNEMGYHKIMQIIKSYKEKATAVVFMGGLSNGVEPHKAAELINKVAESVPTGLYTDSLHGLDPDVELSNVRWLKVGRYDKDLGGLASPYTNQIFYERDLKTGELRNITGIFYREDEYLGEE